MKKDKKIEIKEKDFDIEEREHKIAVEQDDVTIKKIESLIRLLEATEPYDIEPNVIAGDKYPFRSILDVQNKDIVLDKIFELLLKY